uniref:DDRGK domain-containing protein 1 n=1 Tax=Aplanochytrium stocchinoi TaxID=215587 RepID=A0A7S3PIA7_9STRA|mmetsp:Transcript_24788/g.30333  ORF Transcript_24788/g.30333 Transcript_24788/m.30333 type:complete len:333 (+) Transcript_24788:256-1254(+)|eukprot:CAMPEP_0204828414 /NCGR_PEP_ID=MMETSP1346-20131115/6166_1 /ASSEMBLY_ACC=CAM_ASM_000771 /TAXON_ID=215587 /ORGANISM="Aplanochytrium stocchinoi, Strain GSBS06" /LENGTH=332 /DNA_ID=CAMNT_0051957461 /DNA_START=191 /DNA_END=1189 /DNA_ORIENTATION=-
MAEDKHQPQSMGFDLIFLIIGLLGLTGLALALYVVMSKTDAPKKKDLKPEPETNSKPLSRQQRRLRNRKSRRGMAAAESAAVKEDEQEDSDENEEDNELNDGAAENDGDTIDVEDEEGFDNLTNKQMRRAVKKREARERREAMEAARKAREEQMDARSSAYDEKQKKKEEERMQKQEESRKRMEEEKQKAEEEFEQWKDLISVVEEGSNEKYEEDEVQDRLRLFIEHVREKKVVMLEELAIVFNLRTQEAINRLESLEKMGRITGVFDDRGKFIYITKQEMEQVTAFILKKGRISISEVAKESNKLIDLNPKNINIPNENMKKGNENDQDNI